MSRNVKRLFAGFRPEQYEIELTPNRDTMALHGTVVVTGQKVGRPSQRLTFHQNGLRVMSARVIRRDKKGEREISVTRINHHNSLNEVRLHADELLYPGQYTVTMTFAGKIQDSLHGVYLCNYEVDGQKQTLVSTQFESHFAREAFPCIDEPEAKASFVLTLLTPEGETALSNMPEQQHASAVVDGHALTKTTFEPTPRMSTYLLAFVVGDLQATFATTEEGIKVGIWATKAHKPSALDFALDVAVRSIKFFNDYYDVPYPLKTCNHVAVPDFAVGAMENWGLITYRETCLLADPATTPQSSYERIATVIAHELSHQWFGDLVTMRWWDDLWLNESFANVMEYVATDALFPEWHIWDTFAAEEGLSAIRRDCMYGVQAIKTTVRHPEEISSLFDPSIVYAKGGRLLNMLKHFIGEDTFRQGLKTYFERHAYGNTTGEDLWKALSEASGKDIARFMNPWLERSGFPLISVDQRGIELGITQSHFLLDAAKSDAERVWPVPLFSDSKEVPALLDSTQKTLSLSQPAFVQVNADALGHYIVRYSQPEHLAAIAERAASKQLSTTERLMLLSDSSLLARAGHQSFATTLELVRHYGSEDSEPVWDIMALTIGECRRFIDVVPDLEPAIKAFIRSLIKAQYARLGWAERAGESSADTKLRAIIMGLGVYAEHPAAVTEALKLFETYKKDATAVPSELRDIVCGAAVRTGAPGAFDYLLQLDEQTSDVNLKQDILSALTITRQPKEIATLLGRLTDATKVRPQDFDHWIVFLLRNRYARKQTWQWFQANWGWIEQTFKGDQTYDHYPRYVASTFSTAADLKSYKAFFEPKTDQPALTRNIAVGIEEIATRAAWLSRDLTAVQSFFALYK